VSLRSRLVAEVGEFLHVVLLFAFLRPALAPLEVVVRAAPREVELRWWYGVVLAALGVAVVRWLDPPHDLVRAFVFGLVTTALFVGLYVLSGLGRVVDGGGSWPALAGVVLLWAVALGVGVALVRRRTWRALRARVAPE
jgi:hypothetical protein